MIKEKLLERNLPELLVMNNGDAVTAENWEARRAELLDCLQKNLYGYTPPAPKEVRAVHTGSERWLTFGGKAKSELYDICFDTPGGEFSFPIKVTIPTKVEKPPVVVYLSFGSRYPLPIEEIVDNGFALVEMYYHLVEHDANHPEDYFGHFIGGLGEKFFGGRQRERTECGKVGLWAYAASRIMDYLQTRDDINKERIAVAGHSRLGKTALWCKAQDPRFYLALGNNTNYGGGGLIRGHVGEDVPDFLRVGSFDFFCEGWKDFLNVPHGELPFDQHFLLACHAPGLVYLTGATKDEGMDPLSEFLSCHAASEVYRLLGKQGLVSADEMPEPLEVLHEGEIGFHYRDGGHYLSRADWMRFLAFFERHL